MPAVATGDLPQLFVQVVEVLRDQRWHYGSEGELQEGIAAALQRAGLPVQREVRLTARERIDALVGRVGIEAKVAGNPRALERQLTRYAHSDLVDALVVVTNRVRHRPPAEINGKPVMVISLIGAGL